MFGPACISHDVMAVNKCNQLHSVTSATPPRSMLFFRIRTILVKKKLVHCRIEENAFGLEI